MSDPIPTYTPKTTREQRAAWWKDAAEGWKHLEPKEWRGRVIAALDDLRDAERRAVAAEADAAALREALAAIVHAWESVPLTMQVPDEINVDALWNAAKATLARPAGAATERLRALEEVAETMRRFFDEGDKASVLRAMRDALARLDAHKSPVEGGGE